MLEKLHLWALAGAVAPVVYVVAVVLGGALTPGYSHVAGPIGALTMAGAPAVPVLVPLFALYNALLAAFALTLRDVFRERVVRLPLLAPTLLAFSAILGALMLVYPMDPLGVASTESGRLHAWFAGLGAVANALAVLFTAIALRRYPAWRDLGLYSLISFAIIAVSGVWASNTATELSPLLGMAERVTAVAFLQWLFVVGLILWSGKKSD